MELSDYEEVGKELFNRLDKEARNELRVRVLDRVVDLIYVALCVQHGQDYENTKGLAVIIHNFLHKKALPEQRQALISVCMLLELQCIPPKLATEIAGGIIEKGGIELKKSDASSEFDETFAKRFWDVLA